MTHFSCRQLPKTLEKMWPILLASQFTRKSRQYTLIDRRWGGDVWFIQNTETWFFQLSPALLLHSFSISLYPQIHHVLYAWCLNLVLLFSSLSFITITFELVSSPRGYISQEIETKSVQAVFLLKFWLT